jgi:CMP-N-acetylneuraminic acid synthetase
MSILAIIPARSGSKRLPGKNIKTLCGKPLIQWTIDAARAAVPSITEVMVSTDGGEIAELSIRVGAKVPLLRDSSLASDVSSTVDVIKSVIEYYKDNGKEFEFVLVLQPTSPLRCAVHIEEAIALLKEKKADSVVSVCPAEHSPLWANTLNETQSMNVFIPDELKNLRSQDLPEYYRLNGAIFLTRVSRFLDEGTFLLSDNSYAYIMDSKSSVDIDEELDFLLAEVIINNRES